MMLHDLKSDDIVDMEPDPEYDAMMDAGARAEPRPNFITYHNYVRAYSMELSSQEQARPGSHPSVRQTTTRLTDSTLQETRALFRRGILSYISMEDSSAARNPELYFVRSFWAPVQAYYAVHGVGLAAIVAMCVNEPKDHRRFRNCVATQLAPKLPKPLNMTCAGDATLPGGNATVFTAFSGEPSEVVALSNLKQANCDNSEMFVAKALFTTRKHNIESELEKKRKEKNKGRIRRNISAQCKAKIARNIPPTTFVDFLWRLRLRSNYDEPEMFFDLQYNELYAKSFYTSLVSMTRITVALLRDVLAEYAGSNNVLAWESDVRRLQPLSTCPKRTPSL